jgi:predicted nicotinamide N-methyase
MTLPLGHPGTALGGRLRVQPVPSCPSIRLWLLDADEDLDAACRGAWDVERPPMWAFCWASGQALARFLLDHPERVAGLRVVDFGCGSGVVAIAAAMAGAREVSAVDADAEARLFARANADENGVTIDVRPDLPGDYDLILASDVLYERGVRDHLVSLHREGRALLIADALRPGTPPPPVEPFVDLPARTFPDVDPPMDRAYLFDLR